MTAIEFLSAIPSKIKSQGETDINTIIHFDFGSSQYSLKVVNGEAELIEGLHDEPEVSIKSREEDFAKIVAGDMNPMTAMMFGKLKISNPGAMMKYAKMLGIM